VDNLPAGVVSQPDMMMVAWRWVGRCRCGVGVWWKRMKPGW
jgi:hypothetical protein